MSKNTGHWWLVSSGILFGIYCLNVAVGKIALVSDQKPIFAMGDVGEFVVLFAAVICFVITMLEREAHSQTET
jgi:heme A synthase